MERVLIARVPSIQLGLRGVSDAVIIARLNSEELLFVTQDQDFLDLPLTNSAVISISLTRLINHMHN